MKTFTLLFAILLLAAVPASGQSIFDYRIWGVNTGAAIKAPVVAATTAAITLSGAQTIDGVSVKDHLSDNTGLPPDRVLVKNQTDQTTNGIYNVNSSGAWKQASDFTEPNNIVQGTIIPVVGGTQAGLFQVASSNPVVVAPDTAGASNITFSVLSTGSGSGTGDLVNVMAAPYGAVCNGTTDDTAAFTAALATGQCVYIPPTANGCAVKNLTVPSQSCMMGISVPQYSIMRTASRLVPASGASKILNVSGSSNIAVSNFDIFCGGSLASPTYSSPVTGISSGSTGLYLSEMSIHYCGNGGIGDTSFATTAMVSEGSTYFGNGQANSTGALINLVDSRSTNETIASNYNGSYLPTGANDNSFSNDKIEWNANFGIVCFQCEHTSVSGGISDSNANGGIEFAQATAFTVSGGVYRRNGSTNGYGTDQDFYFNGGSTGISITGITTDHGKNDDGSGVDRPAYIAFFNTNSDTAVNIQDDDFSGFVTAPIGYNATSIGSGIISHNTSASPKYVGNDATSTAYSAAELTALGAGGSGTGTVNAGTAGNLAYYATSTTAVSPATKGNISNGQLTLGTASSAAGSVILEGSTSGASTLAVPAIAGSGTKFVLPPNNGTNTYVLQTDGSGNTSWVNPTTNNNGLVLLATVNASGATSVSFGSAYITNAYNKYVIEFDGVYGSTTDNLGLAISTNNGSSWISSGYSATGSVSAPSSTSIQMGSGTLTNVSTTPLQGTITFSNPSASKQMNISIETEGNNTSAAFTQTIGAATNSTTTAVNAIKIYGATNGANLNGNFHLYGISGT